MEPFSMGTMLLGGAAWGGVNSLLGIGANAADAALQYHYAKKMYQHRYRWAVDDMRKAGINPVLAANGGNVSGMGSAPQTDFSGAVQSGINTGIASARALSEISKTRSDAELVDAQKSLTDKKALEQDIRNVQLPIIVREQAAKACAETSLANSAVAMAQARERFADVYAENERNESWARQHTMTSQQLASSAAIEDHLDRMQRRMDPRTEKKLAEELYRAKILYWQLAPLWSGVNSASHVIGK